MSTNTEGNTIRKEQKYYKYKRLIEERSIPAFIAAVKAKECIWNPDHENYNDRYETMVAWKEIADGMDQPEDVLRSKWKNLRDLFRREMKKKCNNKITSVEQYNGTWRYFKRMWFVNRQGEAVNTDDENTNDKAQIYFELEEDDDNPLDSLESNVKCEAENGAEFPEEVYLDVNPDPPVRKRKREDDDFDMMYLKSLTPYFRQLDPIRKLIVRSKIQDILINEIAAQQAQVNSRSNHNRNS